MDKKNLHQLNSYETDFVYHEIFEKNVYWNERIHLRRKAVVMDIGANIGLFCLFVKTKCPTAAIYAFEPIPDAYGCLTKNCAPYGKSIQTQKLAISNRKGTAKFCYYPGYSVISGLYADRKIDSQVIEAGMRESFPGRTPYKSLRQIRTTLNERFRKVKYLNVKTQTVSGLVEAFHLKRIDLLKIDAERSEPSILQGIAPKDWPKIRQVVLEVHSHKDRRTITRLLESKGYEVTSGKAEGLSRCEIGMLYAKRSKQ